MDIDKNNGLTSKQVEERIKNGLSNYNDTPKTKSIGEIIRDNIFTYFNFLNLILAVLLIIASIFTGNVFNGLKNSLFMGVVICNAVISIIEEIISKRIIDKLAVVSETKVNTLRDGKVVLLGLEEIVKDDIIKLSLGHQVVADSVILEGEIEVNESLITGESDAIKKTVGDNLLSGSFIVSGNAKAQVIHVGKDNYVSKITNEAKYKKDINSVVMDSFVKMLKILSIMIVPIGIIMLINQYFITNSLPESIFTTVASLVGMIPDGLILLTSSVMAVGVIKLYKVNVLVQELYAIEILARVDTICLDKTGTLTEGKMVFVDLIPINDKYTKDEVLDYLKKYTGASSDTNQTMNALKDYFKEDSISSKKQIAFNSERKYSAIEFDDYTLYMGAPDIIFNNIDEDIVNQYIDDYRIVALGIKIGKIDEKLDKINKLGYILIADVIRPSAKETLDYFKDNNVNVKIISGDNIKTVLSIAKKVGLNDIKGIDIGNLSNEELGNIIDDYQIYGRSRPEQKKYIVSELQKKGHIVAMTGDGVNDVLALKESDCAISVKSGSDAARNVSQLILLNDDFNSLPKVVGEGRQTINNVERSASLLLVKTLYTMFLIIYSIITMQKYFFIPIQLTFITAFTIGTPSFVLALEPNNELVKGNFLLKIFSKSLPVSLTILINIIIVTILCNIFNLSYEIESSICVIITTITGLYYLFKICRPLNLYRGLLFLVMCTGFILGIVLLHDFFNIVLLSSGIVLNIVFLSFITIIIYEIINYIVLNIFHKYDVSIKYK